jgi:hypothetical protein
MSMLRQCRIVALRGLHGMSATAFGAKRTNKGGGLDWLGPD